MELTERIARLINPTIPWDEPSDRTSDAWLGWECFGPSRDTAQCAARRVIDGLNLEEEHVYSFNGDRIIHVLGQIHEEDM